MPINGDVERGEHELRDGETFNNGRAAAAGNGQIRPPKPVKRGLSIINADQKTLPDVTPSSVSSTFNDTSPGQESGFNRQWRRSDRRLRRLNTKLLKVIDGDDRGEVEKLIKAGANPNATCRLTLVSACHLAAMSGGDALSLLLKFGAEKLRVDKLGRTPLHLAAWAGNSRQVAILLDFPEDTQDKSDNQSVFSQTEEDNRKLTEVRCYLAEVNIKLPMDWEDSIDHACSLMGQGQCALPVIQPGWTPLHVASACVRKNCTRILLAAGASPNIIDDEGRTTLDVIGYASNYQEVNKIHFTELIRMLLKAGGQFKTMRPKGLNNIDTPIHTPVEMENIEAIKELLNAGAGVSNLNKVGLTPLHICVKKQLENELHASIDDIPTITFENFKSCVVLADYDYNQADRDTLSDIIDVKDRNGRTILQAAIEADWVKGLCIALEFGADVTLKTNDGDTPLHTAATLGNIDMLNEILNVAIHKGIIDYKNEDKDTPLIKAISNGHEESVKKILSAGASISVRGNFDESVFHVAAMVGYSNILRILLENNEEVTKTEINSESYLNFAPIHYAVFKNRIDCVELLLSKNANVRTNDTCTFPPLHLAALYNRTDISKMLLKYDTTTVHEVNSMGWYPLHTASHHGSRDVITLLLKEGADLSGHTNGPEEIRRTAIDMIMYNLSNPTEFMEEIFDSYILSNERDLQDPDCKVTVDYSILMPGNCEMQQMKVIEALLKTGNRYGQRKLLVHPLVESFLYLKWKALLPFFYTIITFYGLFLGSLTIFIISVFFYKDTNDTPPDWLNTTICSYIVYVTITLVLIQELLYMDVKKSRYFLQLETWVKFGSLALAVILLSVFEASSLEAEWPRHVATLALLLSWLEMMFLLSRFMNVGYFILAFGKVASNVVKILLIFMFMVVGFSLSFMIQFRTQMPFEGPWAALVKTIVMMTSEFDYGALFDEEKAKELGTSLVIVRIIFLVFLILAAIVLMNLLQGFAVKDINDLEVLGNIGRLAKQVEFLGILDTDWTILPRKVNNKLKEKRKVPRSISFYPGKPNNQSPFLPSKIKDSIFSVAQSQTKQLENELGDKAVQIKLNEIHENVVKIKNLNSTLNLPKTIIEDKNNDIIEHLDDIDDAVSELKGQTKSYVEESRGAVEKLNVKMDQISLDMEAIKEFLKISKIVEHLDDVDDVVSEIKGQIKSYIEESRGAMEKLNVKINQISLGMEAIVDDAVSGLKGETESYIKESRVAVEKLNVKMDQMSLNIEAIKEFLESRKD